MGKQHLHVFADLVEPFEVGVDQLGDELGVLVCKDVPEARHA